MALEETIISVLLGLAALVVSVLSTLRNTSRTQQIADRISDRERDITRRLTFLEGRQAERDRGKSAV